MMEGHLPQTSTSSSSPLAPPRETLLTGSTPYRISKTGENLSTFRHPLSACADVDADRVTAFGEPDWARTVYAIPVTVIGGEHTLLRRDAQRRD